MLFENSIVCHVFYAIALGAAHGCVWSFGVCFVLVCLALICVGVGLGFGLGFWTVGTGWSRFWFLLVLFGEFDPGSGRTLAACLTHASRTVKGPAFVGPG